MTMRIPSPICHYRHPQNIDDGTLARQPSSPPGVLNIMGRTMSFNTPPIQFAPTPLDHTRLGARKRLHNDKWFEKRFPNTLKAAHLHFAEIIYSWAIDPMNKGKTEFKDNGRTKADKTRVIMSPFHDFDKPQSEYENVKLLGHFTIDLETPLIVERNIMNGAHGIKWKGIMYIEDILGDSNALGLFILNDMRSIRGKWKIETDMTNLWSPTMQFRTFSGRKQNWTLDLPGPSSPYLTSPHVRQRYVSL